MASTNTHTSMKPNLKESYGKGTNKEQSKDRFKKLKEFLKKK